MNFLRGVASFSVRVQDTLTNKTFIVHIRPTTREIAALFVTELFSNEIQKDTNGCLTIYDHHADSDVDVITENGYVFLDLSHRYTIAFMGEVLVVGFILSNGHTSLLSSLFTFPPTKEEQDIIDKHYFTLILKGNMVNGSNVIKVSSTDGLVEGRLVYDLADEQEEKDEDEDEEDLDRGRVIHSVDHENLLVTVDVGFNRTATNVSVVVR
jgi:hypothetical protein